jgi:quercetin dioxygenase-like cupin family protein
MSGSRAVLLAGVALALGVVLGAVGGSTLARQARPGDLAGAGRLETLPPGPVEVIAEAVELPAGFVSHHAHGGPTFNLVRDGVVVIDDQRGTTSYRAGGFFFEPADTPHRIRVESDARLEVIRLLPPGARATTELRGG